MKPISRVVLVFRRKTDGRLIALSRNDYFYYQDGVRIGDEAVVRGCGKQACGEVITRLQLPGVFAIPDKSLRINLTEGWWKWKKEVQLRVFVVEWSNYGEARLIDFPFMDPVQYHPHGHKIERKVNEQLVSLAA